jgi:dihydroorotate dehydrogenase electron transfer subunit
VQHPDTRNTINLEDAKVLSHQAYAGDQFILRLHSPGIAAEARPGSFVHIRCDISLPMRRPMSIMRTSPKAGWIDILYKAHGEGTRLLARQPVGATLSVMGPIGVPFKLTGYRKRPLLLGGGVGIPPMINLAEHILNTKQDCTPLVLAASEVPFPFTAVPSRIMVEGMPDGVIATMPLLEDWNIPCRLASLQGYAGCYAGYITDLARVWLNSLDATALATVEMFCCGPTPMLKAVAKLAHEFNLPCQVSLEEFMACAVGGCAGCTVEVQTESGPAMKRVCVDGPVFEAAAVYPQ